MLLIIIWYCVSQVIIGVRTFIYLDRILEWFWCFFLTPTVFLEICIAFTMCNIFYPSAFKLGQIYHL